jgi:hypothetical protein
VSSTPAATAGEFEGEHPTEAAHLTRSQHVLWMARQAGVVHPGHGGVALQRFREGLAVFVVPGHAQRQRAQTTQEQPGIEGSQCGAGEQCDVPDLVQKLRRAGHHSGGYVGVAVEIFGGAVPADLPAYENFHAIRLANLPSVAAVTSYVTMKTLPAATV